MKTAIGSPRAPPARARRSARPCRPRRPARAGGTSAGRACRRRRRRARRAARGCAATPLARNAVTFSCCQASRSSRSSTAILVSKRTRSIVPPGAAASCTFLTCPAACGRGRPRCPGIVEVFHARFTDHAYPEHTHDAWTLLLVDEGAVRYDLDRHEHGALRAAVTLLPPHVAHTGRAGHAARLPQAGALPRRRRARRRRSPAPPSTARPATTRCCGRRSTSCTALDRPGEDAGGARAGSRSSATACGATCGAERRAGAPTGSPPTCGTCSTPTSSTGSPWRRGRACCTPTPRTSCARSPRRSGCRRTATSPAAGSTGPPPPARRRARPRSPPRAGFHDQAHLTRHFPRLSARRRAASPGAGRDRPARPSGGVLSRSTTSPRTRRTRGWSAAA